MAKATTLNKAGAKAAKVPTKAAMSWDAIGEAIGEAILTKRRARKQADDDHAALVASLESPVFDLLKSLADEVRGIDQETFVEKIQPAMLKALGKDKMDGNMTKYRHAFIGLSNGLVPGKDDTNAQVWGDKVAKPAMIKAGKIKASKAGRTQGSSSPSKDAAAEIKKVKALSADARIVGFAAIFPGDSKTQAARVNFLSAIVEGDPDAKLFDKLIADLARKFQ